MPELPEVHTITQDLNEHVSGHVIEHIVIAERYKVLPDRKEFIEKVKGARIKGARRVAKNIVLELDNGQSVVFHLAMTGRMLLREEQYKEDNWIRVLFVISNEAGRKHLRFTDMRMFGKVALVNNSEINKTLEEKYGPEIIDPDLTDERFFKIIGSKRTNIKNVLLDQSLVAGLGNIYATDALFLAMIHPATSTKDITKEQASLLLKAAKQVINEGIKHRGSTLPDKMYVDIFGKEGKHQEHFKIYMKQKCPVCGTKVKFVKLNGRGTYFCPNCQPEPSKGTK